MNTALQFAIAEANQDTKHIAPMSKFDLEEEALLVQLEQVRARKATFAANVADREELSVVLIDISDCHKMLQELLVRKEALEAKLGIAKQVRILGLVPGASKCEAAYNDPVRFSKGNLNVKGTAEKHNLSYVMFKDWMHKNHTSEVVARNTHGK